MSVRCLENAHQQRWQYRDHDFQEFDHRQGRGTWPTATNLLLYSLLIRRFQLTCTPFVSIREVHTWVSGCMRAQFYRRI
jgi:hypothetical protein